MKWLLPEPKEPERNEARLARRLSAAATRSSASSKAFDQVIGDDVVVDGRIEPALADALGEVEDVVLGARALGDRDDVLQQDALGHDFAFLPRVGAGGRHAASDSRVAPSFAM